MARITSKSSPFTLLQQRLEYTSRFPERTWTNIVETVPQWPEGFPVALDAAADLAGNYAPANGYPWLIDAICARERARYGLAIDGAQVLVTNGALHGLSLIFDALRRPAIGARSGEAGPPGATSRSWPAIRARSGEAGPPGATSRSWPGARVLCQKPVLGSIGELLIQGGFQVSFFEPRDGTLDLDALRSAASGGDVRAIYLNTPHNPSGATFSDEILSRVVALARELGAIVVVDMVYDDFLFDGAIPANVHRTEFGGDGIYTVNSMSKNFGAPGLRVGWVISSAENIARLGGALERQTVAVSGVSQAIAHRLFEHGNAALVERARAGRSLVSAELRALGTFEFREPAGGVLYLLKLPVDDVEAFGDFVLAEHGLVLTTSSNYHGLEGPYIRVPVGLDPRTLERALKLLTAGLADYAIRERR